MADKKFNITFDVNANINPIKNAVSGLQQTLSKLNVPANIQKGLNNTFTNLTKEIETFESLTSKGFFTDMAGVNKAQHSFEKIADLLNKLKIQAGQIKGVDPNKLLPEASLKRIQELQQGWEKLQASMQKKSFNTEEIQRFQTEIDKAQKKVDEFEGAIKSKATSKDRLAELLPEGTTLDTLSEKIKIVTERMKELEEAKKTRTGEYKGLKEELNSLLEQKKEIEGLQKSLSETEGKIAKLGPAAETSEKKIAELTKKIEELKDAGDEAPKELDELRQKIAELKNVDISKIPTDIEGLGREISNLNNAELDKIRPALEQLDTGLDKVTESAKPAANAMDEVADSGRQISERAREVEQLANQVKQFFSIGNTVQLFKRAIRSAFDTIKELDAVMTQTAVVTDFTVGDMWAQLPEYTKRANELGVSVKGAYEAATLYYQQGLNTNQVIGVSNETLKMAKIAAIDYATATDYMTSALRGFNMEVNEASARQVNDIYSQLAAKTAADTEEISIAMSKTAPLAHNAGMEIQTTAAFLAQAIETTREAPETIGTAMKTVIARFQELKKDPALIEPVEGEIVDANKIEGALRTIGVALRDTSGQFRDLDDVFLEISQKWDSLDTNTQRYIATIAAGSRQQSRFIAMMANYDRTMELVEMANTSAGASQMQFEKTLDSMQSKLDRLKNAWNEFTMGLANNSIIKAVVDLLTDLLNTINKISSGVSGNNGILKSLIDIGILAGGLKLARGIFTGFFGWLTKTGEKTSNNFAVKLLSGLTGEKLNKLKQQFSGIFSFLVHPSKNIKQQITDITGYITRIKTGMWNLNDVGQNLIQNGHKGLGKIVTTLSKIPPQAYAIAGGIAAIAAVVALVVKGIKDNSIEGRIKKAEEQTKLAQTAAENAKEAYDNLLEGKSKYSDLQTTLDNLTYGTKAWKEALIEANGQVLQLLQTYPQLAQYLTSSTDGRLQISDSGWDTIIKEQEDAIRRTTNNLIGSQIYRANLENEKLFKDLQKTSGIQRKGLLEELIGEYEQNPSFFTKDKEGQYNEDLQSLAKIYGVNPEKIYEAQNAIREYEAAIQQNGITIESYVDSLISNNGKLEGLDPKIAETIQEAYNKIFGEDYNKYIDRESQKLFNNSRDGREASLGYINSLLEGYGLEAENTLHNGLQTLYKHLANITGEEIEDGILQSDEAMAQAIAQMRFGDTLQTGIQEIAEILEKDASGSVQKVLDVLAHNFEKFSFDELENLANLATADIKDFAKTMGLSEDEFKKVLNSLGYTFEEFKVEFANAADEMAEQIKQSKINLVQAMVDTGAFKDSRTLMASLAGLTDQQITSISGITNQISGLNNDTQASILKSLPGLFRTDEVAVKDLFKGLDFSDPISSLKSLQEEAENSTTKIGQLAQQIIDMEPELFNAGNLFRNFMQSTDFENLNDDLQDFVKTNGKISASNVKELANQSNKLNNLLKTGTVSAGGLAKALTAISTANVPMESFTTHVLEALSAVNTFDDRLGLLQENLANFDPGLDEGALLDSFSGYIEKLEGYAEKGQYNNTAFQNYFRQIYGEEGLAKVIQSGNGQQIANAFDSKMAQAKQWLSGDGYGFWADLASDANNALVSFDEQSDIFIDAAGRTTDELIADLSKISGASEDFVAAQLAGFSAHSFDLRKELAENDFNKQIQQLMSFNGNQLAVLNESEIQAFAIATGRQFDEVITQIEEQTDGKIKIVNFIDEETGVGALGDNLIGMIEDQLSGVEKEFNFLEDLNLADAVTIDKNGTLLLDIEQITGRLEELGLTAEQINSIFESDSFNNWLQNAQTSIQSSFENQLPEDITRITDTLLSKTIEIPVRAVDEETGQEYVEIKEVVVTADSVEGLTAAENAAMEAANYDLVGQSIVNQDFSALGSSIEGILNTAAQNAAANLRSEINNVKFNSKSVKVRVTYQEVGKPAILSLQGYSKGTVLNLNNVWSKITKKSSTPSVNNKSSLGKTYHPKGSGGRTPEYANGTGFGGLKHNEIALTGEEGYELAYNKNGAFLLGENGPEITKLEKGTVIYPHDLSKKILKSTSKKTFPNYATGIYTAAQKAEGGIYVNTSNLAGSFDSLASSMKETAEAAEEVTEETEKWENTVDWLYNMTQKVNQELRVRNKLEKQYNRALKTNTGTGEDLRRLTNQEIVSLKKRQDMQKEMIELRKKELHTYMMLNKEMMKYAIIDNWDDMTIHIAWDSINSITDKDEYDKAVDFLNRIEDVQKEIYDLEDDIEDIEDELIELKERGKEQYRNLEDRVLDALISEQQEMIDEQEKTIKAIDDAESSLIDAIQKNIDKMRQDRENEETESSIAEKERRLAYLRQDTTGSNALEIKKLEDELAKEKQDYSDALIDQALKDLKDQNDIAKEQRDKQIEIAQSQLEWQEKTGYWADEATRIVREGIGNQGIMDENSRLYKLLYDQEGVDGMSNASKDWWKEELETTIKEAYIYLANVLEPQNNGSDVIESMKQNSQNWMTASSGEQSNLHAENERLAREYEAATGEKLTYNSSEGAWYKENGQRLYTISKDEIAHDIVAKMRQNSNAWGSASESKQKELAAENEELARRLKNVLGQDITKKNGVWYIGGQELYKKYKRGGLADFTGPAWLDGSKTKPEMVLNAKDTQNFIQLKDILAGLRSGIVGNNQEQSGDWYFDIDINVGEIANDYDVDKVADRVKQAIYKETTYRNVNAINFLK